METEPVPLNKECNGSLEASRISITQSISHVGQLVTYLQSVGVLDGVDAARIKNPMLILHDQIEALVNIILTRNQNSFEEFVKSLLYYKCEHVVTIINEQLAIRNHNTIDIKEMLTIVRKSDPMAYAKEKLLYCETKPSFGAAPTTNLQPETVNASGSDSKTIQHIVKTLNPTKPDEIYRILKETNSAEDVGKYEFSGSNCAVLIIKNFCFPQRIPPEREGHHEETIALETLIYQTLKVPNEHIMAGKQTDNLTSTKILEAVRYFITELNKVTWQVDGVAVFIVTHGRGAEILGIDEQPVALSDIFAELSPEKCPKLAQKPKLFFIEACRGDNGSPAYQVAPFNGPPPQPVESRVISRMDDIFVAFPTGWGYYSVYNLAIGSYFFHVLAHVIENSKGKTIDTIMKKGSASACLCP